MSITTEMETKRRRKRNARFYELQRETGRFLSLVCEGIGARAGRQFPGSAALVQHAGSVARTKGRLAYSRMPSVACSLCWGAGQTTPFTWFLSKCSLAVQCLSRC